jgi:vacuolar-type H+-ATPase subunit H
VTTTSSVKSDTPPLLIALAAGVLLFSMVGIIPSTQRVFDRLRTRRRRGPEGQTTRKEWMYRPPAPGDEQVDPLAAPAEASAGVDEPRSDLDSAATAPPSVEMAAEAAVEKAGEAVAESAAEPRASVEREQGEARHESEAEAARITEDARRQARELIQAAELEAKGIVVLAGQNRARRENDLERLALEERRMRLAARATAQEAERKAEELLAATEAQCRSLVREAESEAERKATEIVEDAWRRARERLEEAELESKGIVVETGKERARLLNELALERALVEETRTRFESLTVIEEAARRAEELLLAAEQRQEELQRESEGEAERKAAEIAADARRQAQELLEEAKLEAARIVGAAERERAQLVDELLVRQRSVFEETRERLAGFLSDALEEVEGMPAAREATADSRNLDEALVARTSGDS